VSIPPRGPMPQQGPLHHHAVTASGKVSEIQPKKVGSCWEDQEGRRGWKPGVAEPGGLTPCLRRHPSENPVPGAERAGEGRFPC